MASIINNRGSFEFGPVLGSMDQYIVAEHIHPLARVGRIKHTFIHTTRSGENVYLWTTPDGKQHGSLATAQEHVARTMAFADAEGLAALDDRVARASHVYVLPGE